MTLDDYEFVEELEHPQWGNVFQIALGGGEPLEHPNLKEIISLTVSHGIVPNLTTNGICLNEDLVDFFVDRLGAIAISCNDLNKLDTNRIKLLNSRSIKTNIHYLLSGPNVLQAIDVLMGKFNHILDGVNSIIFLTYKPMGRASSTNRIVFDFDFETFIKIIDKNIVATRIGFDACFIPILLHSTNTPTELIDSCECGFFSIYIDENLNVKPCSFTKSRAHVFNLRQTSFKQIWENKYSVFRENSVNECKRRCINKDLCRGRCPYFAEINYCYSVTATEPIHD